MKPQRQWRPQLRASMELTALEAAVRGASEDLVAQLGQQIARGIASSAAC